MEQTTFGVTDKGEAPRRIYATITEHTLRRTFREQTFDRRGLTVIDRDLPLFALKVTRKGTKTFIVRVAHKLGRETIVLGKAGEITIAQAREKAVAAIVAAKTERATGPLFADFVKEFMRRQGRRWKPSTKQGNAHLINRYSCRSSARCVSRRSNVPPCADGSIPWAAHRATPTGRCRCSR